MSQGFLPICKKDMEERGWEQLDFVYISGDAYVDHPSFGPAVITRKIMDTRSESSHSRIGKIRTASPFLASQDLLFLYRQVIWILW